MSHDGRVHVLVKVLVTGVDDGGVKEFNVENRPQCEGGPARGPPGGRSLLVSGAVDPDCMAPGLDDEVAKEDGHRTKEMLDDYRLVLPNHWHDERANTVVRFADIAASLRRLARSRRAPMMGHPRSSHRRNGAGREAGHEGT